jgi:ABC-2 type transport system ATP-binding protein
VLKGGTVATYCNLEAERQGNRNFLELETRDGDEDSFTAGVAALGVEMAAGGKQRMKLVLPAGVEVRDLYRLAAEHQVQIRRLDYKKDSLQDIFLKAMETEVAGHGRV